MMMGMMGVMMGCAFFYVSIEVLGLRPLHAIKGHPATTVLYPSTLIP